MIYLKNKLYTSEEASEVIGVTPRTLYRYVKKGAIKAETRTASGTLRFTREEIYKYLYPDKYLEIIEQIKKNEQEENKLYDILPEEQPATPKAQTENKTSQANQIAHAQTGNKDKKDTQQESQSVAKNTQPKKEEKDEALSELLESLEETTPAKTDAKAPDNEKQEEAPETTQPKNTSIAPEKAEQKKEEGTKQETEWKYYINENKSIIDLAKEINTLSSETQRKYAATMYGGLSLHHDIPEFTIVHFYVKDTDLDWWVKELELVPTNDPKRANICLIPTKDNTLFEKSYKLRGLYVVSNERLMQDLLSKGEKDLAKTLA